MTTITASALQPGMFLAAATAIFCMPNAVCQITSAVFTNTDTSVETITVYLVRSGGAAGPANILISAQPLAPGQAYIARELSGRNLAAGDYLAGFATNASKVIAVIDGITIAA